ncbi:MAG: hypothetical protein ACM3O4_01285 [Ignavibacteriales bacterium]
MDSSFNSLTVQDKLDAFLSEYGDRYEPDHLEYIIDNFEEFLYERGRPDILNQIYAELDLVEDDNNLYKEHLKVIKRLYGLGIDILEIGGGFFPIFSKYVDEEQRILKAGTITVYDSKLITSRVGNVILKKEEYTKNISLNQYKLIVGIMPCEATELIIKKANEENKDFYVALCGCRHFPQYNYCYTPSEQEWFNYVYTIAKHSLPSERELDVNYLPESFECHYPIISSKIKVR